MRLKKAFKRLKHRLHMRRRLSIVCPDYTLRGIAIMLLSFAAVALLLIAFTGAKADGSIPTTTMYVCTEDGPLNVRERSSLDSPRVARLERGETVRVAKVESGWALIMGVGELGEGWVSLRYLSDRPPVEAMTFTVEED